MITLIISKEDIIMSNKKKFEKNITKKLEKMYAAAKKNPSAESRLLFVSGKYGFSVIRMDQLQKLYLQVTCISARISVV